MARPRQALVLLILTVVETVLCGAAALPGTVAGEPGEGEEEVWVAASLSLVPSLLSLPGLCTQ